MPAVPVGGERQRRVGDLGFARKARLGHVGHANDRRAEAAVPVRFGPSRERRPFDAHVGTAVVQADVGKRRIGESLNEHSAQHTAHGIGEGHMRHCPFAEEAALTLACEVDELVGQHHVERRDILLHRPDGRH